MEAIWGGRLPRIAFFAMARSFSKMFQKVGGHWLSGRREVESRAALRFSVPHSSRQPPLSASPLAHLF